MQRRTLNSVDKVESRQWAIGLSLLILGCTVFGYRETNPINGYSSIDELRHRFLQFQEETEKTLSDTADFSNNQDAMKEALRLIHIYKRFGDEIEEKFAETEDLGLGLGIGMATSTSTSVPYRPSQTTRAVLTIKAINGLYRVFRQMQRELTELGATLDSRKLVTFAQNTLHEPNASISRALHRLTDLTTGNDRMLLWTYWVSELQCSESQSPQQLIYNLYRAIALTEIKGYSMIQFSYLILRTYNPGSNFTNEMNMVAQDYTTRTVQTLEAVKTAMASAPRDLWRCDPAQHKLDETYTELNQLFQGYIVNEVDLNGEATCWENCAYYEYTKVYDCYQNLFCSQQRRCNGKVINCQYVDADFWICPSSKRSNRRYEYIEYEDGRVYGRKDVCPAATIKIDSWWRWLFWHCSYCFCYCDDHHSNSHRYFSLREVVSDVANNKVITGLKLQKVEKIVHIQIQEGELTTRGAIVQNSVVWKSIDQFSIMDSNVKNGVDYHTLAWEKRALDLDDLNGAQNQLLTGVRFRVVGSRLNLEIRLTPFDFATGKLDQPLEKSFWHSNDITDRKELQLSKPDVPIRQYLKHRPDSAVNQYVNFAASDREKDAAQSTIPFLDIQPVESKPALPMSGAGIFHKGTPGSGGFIAMKLVTFNFAPHLQVSLPPASFNITQQVS